MYRRLRRSLDSYGADWTFLRRFPLQTASCSEVAKKTGHPVVGQKMLLDLLPRHYQSRLDRFDEGGALFTATNAPSKLCSGFSLFGMTCGVALLHCRFVFGLPIHAVIRLRVLAQQRDPCPVTVFKPAP